MLGKYSNIWKPLLSFSRPQSPHQYSRSQSPLWERNVLSSSVTKPVFIALRLGKQWLGSDSSSWWLMKQKIALTVSTVSRFLERTHNSKKIIYQ